MTSVPSNLIPVRVTQLPEAPVASEDSLMMIVLDGNNYKIRVGDLLSVAGVPTSRQVIAGTALTGGGALSSNVTLSVAVGGIGTTQLASTGVTPGVYGDGSNVPVFTVDATGRLATATTVPVTGGGGGSGTVTSVGVSGGSTGLTTSGSPVTTSGTITLSGTLAVANGGTSSGSPSTARNALGAAASGANTDITSLAGPALGTPSSGVATNLTGTATGLTSGVTNALKSATTTVDVSAATAPSTGQALIATSSTTATWQTVAGTGDVVGPASSTDNAVSRFDGTTGKLLQNSVTTVDDTGNAAGILSQQFSDGTAVALAAGKSWYNGTTGSWNLGMGGGQVTQQVGEEFFVYGKASSAISDTNLQLCYKTGTVGASGVITFAPVVASITDSTLIQGVSTESISLNGFGRITSSGIVHGINTTGSVYSETWADNDTIWYNSVTGGLTNVKPVAPNIKVSIGTVISAGSGGSGHFSVDINKGSTLGGTDSNVELTSPASGNLIVYNASLGYWVNNNLTDGTGITITEGAGSVTIANAGVTSLTGTANEVDVSASTGAITVSLPSSINVDITGSAEALKSATTTVNVSSATAPSTGQVLTATSGTAATWQTPSGSGTVTSVDVSGGATGLTTSGGPVTGSGTITLAGTLDVNNGGTGITAGTSGGVLYYSASGTLASSAQLDANELLVGGGAGVAPSSVTTGTGVVTALGVNTGSAGAVVVNGDVLGTPSTGTLTNCTADGTNPVGFKNLPRSGAAKTASYTLATTDVGKFIELGTGGLITVPNSTFATGDIISIFNNTSAAIAMTMSITTSYIGGVNADDNSINVGTRGVANILFISGTVCVVTGNVS